MKYYHKKSVLWLILIIFIHFCIYPFFPDRCQLHADDDSMKLKLNKAEENYYEGNLDIALALVIECLRENSISDPIKLRAHKLMAHILLSKEELQAAKNALVNVLELEPEYQPTIEEEAPRYVTLVEEARREMAERKPVVIQEQTSSGISSWVWIGAGGVAVTAAAVLFLSGNGGGSDKNSSRLPSPPDLP